MTRKRQNMNIEMLDGCKEDLEKIRSWNGMTQKEMVSRLVAWFCKQNRVTQQVILGQIPEEIAPDVARTMLERIADGDTAEIASPTGGRLAEHDTRAAKQAALVGEIPES